MSGGGKASVVALPVKLGLRPGSRVRLVRVPAEVRASLRAAVRGCVVVRDPAEPLDFILGAARSRLTAIEELDRAVLRLAPLGMVWIAWPKKSSGPRTDLNDDVVRRLGLATGLVDVKVCALDATWSALKFVRRLADRGSGKEGKGSGGRSGARQVPGTRSVD